MYILSSKRKKLPLILEIFQKKKESLVEEPKKIAIAEEEESCSAIRLEIRAVGLPPLSLSLRQGLFILSFNALGDPNRQTIILGKVGTDVWAKCDNCSHIFTTPGDFQNIPDLFERIQPGELVPLSQCPLCEALSYPTDETSCKEISS